MQRPSSNVALGHVGGRSRWTPETCKLAVNKYLHTVASCWILSIYSNSYKDRTRNLGRVKRVKDWNTMPCILASNYKTFEGRVYSSGLVLQMFKWVNLPKIFDCHSSRSINNQRYENCLRGGTIWNTWQQTETPTEGNRYGYGTTPRLIEIGHPIFRSYFLTTRCKILEGKLKRKRVVIVG